MRCALGFAAAWLGAGVLAAVHEVEVGEGYFIPDRLAVEVGDRVDWVATSPEHTVTSDNEIFDSNLIWDTMPVGATFSFTFTEPGTYPYYCGLHGSPGGSGMAGVIVVSAATANRAPVTPLNVAPLNGGVDQALTVVLVSGAFSDPDTGDFHTASQWVVRRADDQQVVFDSGDDSVGRVQRAVPAGVLADFTTYSWQVRHRDGRGLWSGYSTPTTFRTLQPVVAVGTGLKASYWNQVGAGDPLAMATNALIQFNWGRERPHRRITADAFAARWEGYVVGVNTERHEFEVQAQGQVKLWVNGELLVDDWTPCSFSKARRGWVSLVAGQPTSIRIDYVADPSGAQAALRWSSPSLPQATVPTANLFPSLP